MNWPESSQAAARPGRSASSVQVVTTDSEPQAAATGGASSVQVVTTDSEPQAAATDSASSVQTISGSMNDLLPTLRANQVYCA